MIPPFALTRAQITRSPAGRNSEAARQADTGRAGVHGRKSDLGLPAKTEVKVEHDRAVWRLSLRVA
jgi:hypothetical protein